MWKRLLFDNLEVKLLALALALALFYVQRQRQIREEFIGAIPIIVGGLPDYMEVHPEQANIRASITIRKPQQILRGAVGSDFRFRIDVGELELQPGEKRRSIPLTEELLTLTSTIREDQYAQVKMVEGSQNPAQVDLLVLPASVDAETVPEIPTQEEGVTSIAMLQWERRVPVTVATEGGPPGVKVSPDPNTVLLRGPLQALKNIQSVTAGSQILNLEGLDENQVLTLRIEKFGQESGIALIDPATAEILIRIESQRARRGIGGG